MFSTWQIRGSLPHGLAFDEVVTLAVCQTQMAFHLCLAKSSVLTLKAEVPAWYCLHGRCLCLASLNFGGVGINPLLRVQMRTPLVSANYFVCSDDGGYSKQYSKQEKG